MATRISDLRREGLSIRGIAAALGISRMDVVAGLDPSPTVTVAEVSVFEGGIPSLTEITTSELFPLTGKPFAPGVPDFDETLFSLIPMGDPQDEDYRAISMDAPGLYRVQYSAWNLYLDADPAVILPALVYGTCDQEDFLDLGLDALSFDDDGVGSWVVQDIKSGGVAVPSAGFLGFRLTPGEMFLNVTDEGMLLGFALEVTETVTLGNAARCRVSLQRIGDTIAAA